MALKPCKECKAIVSTKAKTCPQCGVPEPTINNLKVVLFSISVFIFFWFVLYINNLINNNSKATDYNKTSSTSNAVTVFPEPCSYDFKMCEDDEKQIKNKKSGTIKYIDQNGEILFTNILIDKAKKEEYAKAIC